MMGTNAAVHPTDETLLLHGLGTLDMPRRNRSTSTWKTVRPVGGGGRDVVRERFSADCVIRRASPVRPVRSCRRLMVCRCWTDGAN